MDKLASNATLWMASPSRAKGKFKATTVNQEILRYLAITFGGLCLFFFILALFSAWQVLTTWKSAGIVFIFLLVALGLYFWPLFSSNSFRILVIQTAVAMFLCPFTYLAVEGNIAPWWPGYVILGLSQAVAWSLYLSRTLWAKLILAAFLVNLILTTLLGLSDPNHYHLGFWVGFIGLVGLLLIQMTEVLSQSLSKVYERSLQHRRAKEDLQELTRLKMDFFSNISHEFRTPITLTLGPLEAMLKERFGTITPELRSQLNTMARNQQRLLGLINQVLDISKVEAGAAPLKATKILDFNRFVRERLENFRPAVEARQIQIRHSFDPLVKGTELYIDKEKFDKVISNLLSNALKFTTKGYIEVSTEVQANSLLLKVSDTGIGIKEKEISYIFDRFRQAEGSASREFAGSGLGLALVKEFVILHGGDIEVESHYGLGTSFLIKLPLGQGNFSDFSEVEVEDEGSDSIFVASNPTEDAYETHSSCNELNLEMKNLHDSEKSTVVCAEDNPELRYFLRDMLMDSYNVYVAANGQDALDLVKLRRPHLILSDKKMSGMNGLEFCRKIREDRSLKAIPFVLLTGSAVPASKLESLEEGADDFLTKPFSEPELMTRVKNLVSLRREQLRVERELEEARAIQRALLPKAPQRFKGVTLDYNFYPSEGLSGDFCDILPKGDWIYFYVADVTSHGTASAQVTYLLKEIFYHLVNDGPEGPPLEEIVRDAQKHYSALHLQYFVALQFARFHTKQNTLEVLRANTPTPLKIGRGDSSKNLHVRPSPPLSWEGIKPLEDFHAEKIQLESGDVVYFFTDGCYEFNTSEGIFGLKRFHDLLKDAPDGDQWKEFILESLVYSHGKRHFPDDITFLKIKMG